MAFNRLSNQTEQGEIMDKNTVVGIINLIRKAKHVGDIELANLAFCVLLTEAFGRHDYLTIEVKSEDPKGNDVMQAHYDLVIVNFDIYEVFIPVPLLSSTTIATVMKIATMTNRKPLPIPDSTGQYPEKSNNFFDQLKNLTVPYDLTFAASLLSKEAGDAIKERLSIATV